MIKLLTALGNSFEYLDFGYTGFGC